MGETPTTEAAAILDPVGGGNQSGLRNQNARVVLSFIRRHGQMPSAEIARRSGLSAQTVSNIIRALERDGLIMRGTAIKGRVGKPSVPVTLNPQGVLSLGLNIGRRSAELVLVDFNGRRIGGRETTYAYPVIEDVFTFLTSGIDALYASTPNARSLVSGIGVARPNKLWNWLEVVDAPPEAMRKWRDLDIAAEITRLTGLETIIENDATSACVAEHLLGLGNSYSDFACIFMGAFVGAGLVLNNKVFSGRTGNAAALGPLPVPDGRGGTTEMLNVASLHVLERALAEAGHDPGGLRNNPEDWSAFESEVAPWIDATGRYLAIAAASITSVVEVEAILIDGAMPADVRRRLTEETRLRFADFAVTGMERPKIEEGTVGRSARSIGAAMLPIHSHYFLA